MATGKRLTPGKKGPDNKFAEAFSLVNDSDWNNDAIHVGGHLNLTKRDKHEISQSFNRSDNFQIISGSKLNFLNRQGRKDYDYVNGLD